MKTFLVTLLLLISYPLLSQIIENPGFENWETTTGPNEEPNDWSSIQTGTPDNLAGVAPQVMFKSTDAHSGEFSLRLKNAFVFGIVANGVVTNGRALLNFDPELANVHTDQSDSKWYTICETRPDSIVGYFKYSPTDDDVTVIQALLHTGDGAMPDSDSTSWIGLAKFTSLNEEITEWTRFSAPFEYFAEGNPDYILFNISSGNAFEAVEGSEGWYDDFELVYNPVGIDENLANTLLSVYSIDRNIVIDLSKFGAGEKFDLEIYAVNGQLIIADSMISGNINEWTMEESGVYICKLQSKDGLRLTKKIVIQ